MSGAPATPDAELPAETDKSTGWATSPYRYFLISFFWLPLSLFWGMMLPRIVPTRVEEFAGALHKGAYLAALTVPGALAAAIIQLLIGPISDHSRSRWGRRRPFLLAGTVGAVAFLAYFAETRSFAGLILSFFGVQVLLNVANGPYQAVIPDQVPPAHQGLASAWMGLMQLLGEAGGPIVAGIALGTAAARLDPDVGVDHLMFFNSVWLLAAMAITVLVVPDRPSESPKPVGEALRTILQIRPKDDPDFFRLLVSRAVFNLGIYIALDFLQWYVRDSLHLSAASANKALTTILEVTLLSALAGTFPAGWLADKVSKKKIIYASCGLSMVAGLAFAFTPNLTFAVIMTVFFGLGFGVFRAVDWAFACNLLPAGGAARYMAIWSLSVTLPQVVAPGFGPIGDIINKSIGMGAGWRAAMLATVICAGLGTILVRTVRERPIAAIR